MSNLSSITELYNKLEAKTIQGGRLQPSFGFMPNMRFIFDNGNDKFNTLSILANNGGYETILKNDNGCVYDDSIGYDDVCYFETADEIAKEIKRLVDHLNPSKCESSNSDKDEESDEEESEEKMLRILGKIFHKQLLLGTLHYHNTCEKMINMINQNLIFKCTAEQILKVVNDNKINWAKGSDDPTPYDTYKKEMNNRLAEILSE